MSKVAVSGYYGFRNTGDEAVLYAMLRTWKETAPEVEPVVLSHDPGFTRKTYGVAAADRWRFREVLATLAGSDLLVSGGGSLLQDATSPKSTLYYLGIVLLARLLQKPVAVYAQGVGPLRRFWSRWLAARVLNRAASLITVRDHESAALLKEIGVTRPPLYVTADPVLALQPERMNLPDGKALLAAAGADPERPAVALAIRDWPPAGGYKKAVAAAADRLLAGGRQVVFWPMQFPEDVAVGRDVARLMQGQAILLKQQYTVEEMLALAGCFDLVVGMRLHALIMAALSHVPVVAISCDPKVDSFIKMVEQISAGRVETLTGDNLFQVVAAALAEKETLVAKLVQLTEYLRQEALRTAGLTMALLEKK